MSIRTSSQARATAPRFVKELGLRDKPSLELSQWPWSLPPPVTPHTLATPNEPAWRDARSAFRHTSNSCQLCRGTCIVGRLSSISLYSMLSNASSHCGLSKTLMLSLNKCKNPTSSTNEVRLENKRKARPETGCGRRYTHPQPQLQDLLIDLLSCSYHKITLTTGNCVSA